MQINKRTFLGASRENGMAVHNAIEFPWRCDFCSLRRKNRHKYKHISGGWYVPAGEAFPNSADSLHTKDSAPSSALTAINPVHVDLQFGKDDFILDKSTKRVLVIILWVFTGLVAFLIIIGVINMIAEPVDEETVIHTGDPSDELLRCLKKTEAEWTMEKPANGPVKIKVKNSRLGEVQECLNSVR
jgi:hypothetical protein